MMKRVNEKNKPEEDLEEISSSFRDPSGHLFKKDGVLFRSVLKSYSRHYDLAKESGLYESLIKDGLLISHEEVSADFELSSATYKILKPKMISFISYPYEWSFSQLKDAALLTLEIQKHALRKGMTLKDASAYNISFDGARPVFIDTLSFEKYEEGLPWVAYRQFCQHFLAPLALMSYKDLRLSFLFRLFIDGLPLDLASSLLPRRTMFNLRLASHIHLHAKGQKKYSEEAPRRVKVSRIGLQALVGSLQKSVEKLALKRQKTEWQDYYDRTNYSPESFAEKKEIVSEFLRLVSPRSVWDLGANTGLFSRIASSRGIPTTSFDIDPIAVEQNYLQSKKRGEENLLPLVLDLANPSPSLGWAGEERMSLEKRGPTDVLLALALVHHLSISNNLPFQKIAEYFSRLGGNLIIEFVPKSDSQVRRLLRTRKDIFTDYDEESFEKEFGEYYQIQSKERISGSERILYLMRKK